MKIFIAGIILIFTKIAKTIPSLLEQIEELSRDGVICAKDRKRIAMNSVRLIADQFGFKLSWIQRVIVSVIINRVAKRLPSKDIAIEYVLEEAVEDEVNTNFGPKRK